MKIRIIISCLFILIVLNSTSICQNKTANFTTLIKRANKLESYGDHFTACKLLKFVSENASDSAIIAESLYRLIDYAENVLPIFDQITYIRAPFRNLGLDSIWFKEFKEPSDKLIEDFKQIDIEIKVVSFIEAWWIVNDRKIRPLLATKFNKTYWGERAAFDLITLNLDPASMSPHGVITSASDFLDKYPNTSFIFDVYFILAKANTDIWNLILYDLDENNEKPSDGEYYRLQAIKYYSLVINNKEKLVNESFADIYAKQLQLLKDKKMTGLVHYYSD